MVSQESNKSGGGKRHGATSNSPEVKAGDQVFSRNLKAFFSKQIDNFKNLVAIFQEELTED